MEMQNNGERSTQELMYHMPCVENAVVVNCVLQMWRETFWMVSVMLITIYVTACCADTKYFQINTADDHNGMQPSAK